MDKWKTICKKEKLCTGCGACAQKCPSKCISMIRNEEGFLYPKITEDLCVHCNLCIKICPVNCEQNTSGMISGYVVRNRNEKVRIESTSGGFFTAIAEYVIQKNGLVYGAAYDANMHVVHIAARKSSEVEKMRGSKYVQSDLGKVYVQVEEDLKNGRFVLFTGTPCQVYGIKAYLGKDYANLILIDLVCHGVSSPLIFAKYVEALEKRYKSKVIDIRFRNKTYGYHSSTMKVCFENGQEYFGSGRIDQMSKAYFEGACSRYSCYECPHKGRKRPGDITVFDGWSANRLTGTRVDDNKGFTNILINTRKGKMILESELKNKLDIWNAETEDMIMLDGIMIDKKPMMHPVRENILKELNNRDFTCVMNKYFPIKMQDRIIEQFKNVLFKTGVFAKIKIR